MGSQQTCCCTASNATDKVQLASLGDSSTPNSPKRSESRKSTAKNKKIKYGAEAEEGAEDFVRKSTSKKRVDKKAREEAEKEKNQNILVSALLADFQESLRSRFKTRKQAFDKLGGSDDARIDEQELCRFLRQYGYINMNLNKQLFDMLDADKDGSICRAEFKALFDGGFEELDDFKELLRETFRSRRDAFERLGGQDDGQIDRNEFKEFVKKHMGISDEKKIGRLFDLIDDNHNEFISHAEFKALFHPDGEVAKVIAFKEDLRQKFKNRSAAFQLLGGSDDGKIDRQEFQQFLKEHLGYEDFRLNEQLFDIIDDDNNGFITKGEFEALFLTQTARAVELRDNLKRMLQDKFRSRKQAFNFLGGHDDDRVDRNEFQDFMRKQLASDSVKDNEELFLWMDADNDGFVTLGEFKQFF